MPDNISVIDPTTWPNCLKAAYGSTNQLARVNLQIAADIIAKLTAERAEARRERDELQATFDLQWKRDMELCHRWRAERPTERELLLPDRGNLVEWCWLQIAVFERRIASLAAERDKFIERAESAEAKLAQLESKYDNDRQLWEVRYTTTYDELQAAEATVAKLPVTKDGAPVHDGMLVYAETRTHQQVVALTVVVSARAVRDDTAGYVNINATDCYSSESAARLSPSIGKGE